MDVRALVDADLRGRKANRQTLSLWLEIIESFEQGGPEAVTTLLEKKVRDVERRVNKEEAEIRAVSKKRKRRTKVRSKPSKRVAQ